MSYEGVSTDSPSKRSPVKEGVDDGSLTPIDKQDREDTNPDGTKKAIFNFDINKTVDQVKDLTEKVLDSIPFGNKEKAAKSEPEGILGNKNALIQNPTAGLNSIFYLYGEVVMKRETIKNQKKEADPALFDIEMEEDEFEEQAGLKDQETHKNFGSFFTGNSGKQITKKYETLSVKDLKMYKVEKENTKGGFMSFLKPNLKRFIGFQDGYMIVGELIEETKLKVKSKTHIERLFKLFIEKENSNQLTLVFFNKELNPLMPPVKKTYKFEEKDVFLKALEDEITKCGGKLKLNYNRSNK